MRFPIKALLALPLLLGGSTIAAGTQFFTTVDPATGETVMAVARGTAGAGSPAGNPLAGLEQQLAGTLSDDVAALLAVMKNDPAAMDAIRQAILRGQTATDAVLQVAEQRGIQGPGQAAGPDTKLREAEERARQRAQALAAQLRAQQQAMIEAQKAAQLQAAQQAQLRAQQAMLERLKQRQQEGNNPEDVEWAAALANAKQGVTNPYWHLRPDNRGGSARYDGSARAYLSSGDPLTGEMYLEVDFEKLDASGSMTFYSEVFDGTSLELQGSVLIGAGQNAIAGTVVMGEPVDFDKVFGGTGISAGDWMGAFGGDDASRVSGAWRIRVTDGPNAGIVYGDFRSPE